MDGWGPPWLKSRLIQGHIVQHRVWHSLALSSSITTIRRAATPNATELEVLQTCCRIRYISR